MTPRLKAIYDLICDGTGVIDVGTDHGYIPSALAQSGYRGNIFASDINEGPLASARRTASEAGVDNQIEFILSDGLLACSPDKVDTIIIAGMGGDLMCRILDYAPWVIAPGYKLILQPMTKSEVLRYWLINNGFIITSEHLVSDGNLYQLFTAEYGNSERYTDAELFTGKLTMLTDKSGTVDMLNKLIKRFEHILNGLSSSGDSVGGKYILYKNILSDLINSRSLL